MPQVAIKKIVTEYEEQNFRVKIVRHLNRLPRNAMKFSSLEVSLNKPIYSSILFTLLLMLLEREIKSDLLYEDKKDL